MNEVNSFLKRHNFETNPNMDSLTNVLLEDMENGLKKNHKEISSMDMIPIWKTVAKESPKNRSVITIDAGGTNFRTALLKFSKEGIPEIISYLKYEMPALDHEMSNIEFFDKLAEYLRPLKDKAEFISFCFSFAIKIFPDGSGQAIKLSKEIKLPEIANCKINEELLNALKRDNWKKIKKVVMVNDTASVLQAGALNEKVENFSGFVGFVLGTGLNSAYIENGKIEKLNKEKNVPSSQIVVCESGKCKKVPQSDFDKELSQKSKLSNEYFLERMCSGRYLGELCLIVLRSAVNESLFSEEAKQEINKCKYLTTEEISVFLELNETTYDLTKGVYYKMPESLASISEKKEDCKNIYKLCMAVFKRAGILSAAILASACIKMYTYKNEDFEQVVQKPICISADGSVFLKGFSIRKTIEYHLNDYLTREKGISFVIKNVKNPVSRGSSFFAF